VFGLFGVDAEMSENRTFFELMSQGERKKDPLLGSLRKTRIEQPNIRDFISAVNELPAPVSAELIAAAWPSLDPGLRVFILREWLDHKDKDQQAGGFHALAARLLATDQETAMDLLDRTVKLAKANSTCLKRVIGVTRTEWIGNSIEQSRFRRVDLNRLTNDRSMFLDWLSDACVPEIRPTDDEKRKETLRKQSEPRAKLVADWVESQQRNDLSPPVTAGIRRCLLKLRPRSVATQVPAVAPVHETANPIAPHSASQVTPPETRFPAASTQSTDSREAQPPLQTQEVLANPQARTPSAPTRTLPESEAQKPETDGPFREIFDSIRNLFSQETWRHQRRLRDVDNRASAAESRAAKAEEDAAAYRRSNAAALKEIEELQRQLTTQRAELDRARKSLEDLQNISERLSGELKVEKERALQQKNEAHQAVTRETERERDRLLNQLSLKVRNIAEGYREIKARGPLPEGTPSMIGDMMDELLARLEASGMQLRTS
jgi:hypothetical protein